jgi:hypothetical protein
MLSEEEVARITENNTPLCEPCAEGCEFYWTCDAPIVAALLTDRAEMEAKLAEKDGEIELGEFAKAVNEGDWQGAEDELVQVAASFAQSRTDQALDPQWGEYGSGITPGDKDESLPASCGGEG